ncbi:MAG: hypothetical protein ABIR30_13630 [Chitinophagaceae bacterium]
MSERNISIDTYDKMDNLFGLECGAFIPSVNATIKMPGNQVLNLFNHFFEDGTRLRLREDNTTLYLRFCIFFNEGYSFKDLNFLVNEQENPFDVLCIRIQASCKKSKWCSAQKRISLSEISKTKEVEIEIPLSDTRDSISLSYYLTREIEAKRKTPKKASMPYSILSTGEDFKVLLDEVKDVGGNHFPIFPKTGMGDSLFRIEGLENSVIIPRIYYNDDFEEYFKRDDLLSVNSAFLTFSFYILDTYLRWLIFISSYDETDKEYRSFLDLYSGYCKESKNRISEIANMPKFSQEQTIEYFILSQKLFVGIQESKAINFKKELKGFIKEEFKLKSYESIQNIN